MTPDHAHTAAAIGYAAGLDAGLKVAQHVADLIFGPSERDRAQRMIERARTAEVDANRVGRYDAPQEEKATSP